MTSQTAGIRAGGRRPAGPVREGDGPAGISRALQTPAAPDHFPGSGSAGPTCGADVNRAAFRGGEDARRLSHDPLQLRRGLSCIGSATRCGARRKKVRCRADATFRVAGIPSCPAHLPQLVSLTFGFLNGGAR
jgi:hypothetical protein